MNRFSILTVVLAACGPASTFGAEKQTCYDEINRYRAENGMTGLQRSKDLEQYADEGAAYDAVNGMHAHFAETGGGLIADAENEIPGWMLSHYGTVDDVIIEGTAAMMAEGPGGPHYENILGNHSVMGCGIHVTDGDEVWIVQDFR
jgi:hypothetical protein